MAEEGVRIEGKTDPLGSRTVKRQLPQVPPGKKKTKKTEHKSHSSATAASSSSTDQSRATKRSTVIEGSQSNGWSEITSPPGSKPRTFLGYVTPFESSSQEGEDSSVMVAVRIRPFSER